MKTSSYKIIVILVLSFNYSCKRDIASPEWGGYPTEVGKLMITKCATPGCHTNQSKDGAGGLSLTTWDILFNGGRNGPAVVPFRSDFSPLCYFTNTYSDLGVTLDPAMPLNADKLTREEVQMLQAWVNNGAPDIDGNVAFSGDVQRKKVYLTNQGCDVVTVFDRATTTAMRYVNVGTSAFTEVPHMIKVSPDGKYWYVVFTAGNVVQRFNTSDDSPAGEIAIGSGNWNTITISSDSKFAFVVDWNANGRIAHVDLQNMSLIQIWAGSQLFESPHGAEVNATGDTLYVTAQTGNFIYKIPVADPLSVERISMETNVAASTISSLDIHEILFSPDRSKYFVSCQKSNEVRIIKTSNDSLLKVISVGSYPQEFAVSKNSNYLFVSCPEDTLTFIGKRGSVAVIDYVNNTLVTKLFTGFQPHGMAVDDENRIVYVANRNATTKGPAPHHSNGCGGRNGYVTFIDLNTLSLIKNASGGEKRTEVSVDPYSMSIK